MSTGSELKVYLEQIDKPIYYAGKCSLGNPEFTKIFNDAKILSVEESIKIILELKLKQLIFITKTYKEDSNEH